MKVIACILVVLGHFFQSMTKANILPENDLYQWLNTTIYYFHVPLFFICSGYLYQKYSKVNDFKSWKKNVSKKALALGVPYVTFSTATWVLKTVFSGSVNKQADSLFSTLVLSPSAPYWYLYVAYALISSLATGGNYVFNVIHARKFVKIRLSGIKLIKHLKPVLLIACIIFLSSIYNKIDVTMLNMMATDESVGYYSYAQKTVNMVLTMANAVTAALLPRLSYYYENDREGFYRLLDKGFQILCLMTLPLAVGMALVAEQTVQFLYGEAFAPAALTIQLMCPLILIKGFGDLFCYQLVYSTKSEKIILPAAASASIINIITNAALIPSLLQNGAVVASVISEFVTNAIQFIYMKKKVKFNVNWKSLITGTFSTAVMSVCVLGLMLLKLPNTIGLIVEVGCGALAYIAINLMMKNALMFEMIQKLKTKLLHKA